VLEELPAQVNVGGEVVSGRAEPGEEGGQSARQRCGDDRFSEESVG
jgi:hypothetical protein